MTNKKNNNENKNTHPEANEDLKVSESIPNSFKELLERQKTDFGLIEDEYGNFKELDGMGRIVFPSINLKKGNYRFFVQVKVKESQKVLSKQFDFAIN